MPLFWIETFQKRDIHPVVEYILDIVLTEKLSTDLALQWKYQEEYLQELKVEKVYFDHTWPT